MLFVILVAVITQVWLISYFYPKKIVARMDYVLSHFPEKTHPNLYPISEQKLHSLKHLYQWLNHMFVLFGILIISYFVLVVEDYEQHINILDDLPLLFGMAQFLPLLMLEIFGLKHLKLMREKFNQSQRKASLKPRRLFEFIHPAYLISAILSFAGFIALELYLYDFVFTADVLVKAFALSCTNVLFIIIAMINLYGKKRDPYQHEADRIKQVKFSLKSLSTISIFMSLYLAIHSIVNIYQFNYIEIFVNSIYFQLIALFSTGAILNCYKIEKLNFEAYK